MTRYPSTVFFRALQESATRFLVTCGKQLQKMTVKCRYFFTGGRLAAGFKYRHRFLPENAGEMPGRFIKMPAGAGSRPACDLR